MEQIILTDDLVELPGAQPLGQRNRSAPIKTSGSEEIGHGVSDSPCARV
jgi:hypothetical protein